MAKLTDRLMELGKPSPAPMGFGRPREQRRPAAMLVIGEVDAGAAAGVLAGDSAGATDVVLVRLGAGARLPEGLADALKGRLWGASVDAASVEELDAIQEAGCDFLVIGSRQAPAVVLRDDDMARGFALPLGVSEEDARPLEDLPIDFFTLDAEQSWFPLTVDRLIQLQATVSMVSKHIVLRVAECPPRPELPLVRDLPVDAIAVDLGSITAERLTELRSAVDELPPRKPRSEKNLSPMLPRGLGAAQEDHGHDDDDDDDGDYDDE